MTIIPRLEGNSQDGFVGNLSGNASTATRLNNTVLISGIPFNGTQDISLNSDNIQEGQNNLYFSPQRARESVNGLYIPIDDNTIARLSSANLFTAAQGVAIATGNIPGVTNLNLGLTNVFDYTLTSNASITVSNLLPGRTYIFIFRTGSGFALTLPSVFVPFDGDFINLTSSPAKINFISAYCDGTVLWCAHRIGSVP